MFCPKLLKNLIPVFVVFVLFPGIAHAKTMTLDASADAVVSSYSDPDAGDGGNLHVLHYPEKDSDRYALTLIRFDLSPLPEDININSATLKLFATDYGSDAGSSSDVEVDRNLQNWSEGSVTWSNKPSSLYLNEDDGIDDPIQWMSWDVTSTVKGWVEGEYKNYGFKLKPGDDAFEVKFSSSERNSNTPYIEVNYDVVELPPVDTEPPLILDVVTSEITDTSAKVTYTTDEPATSRIEYGDFSTTEFWMQDLNLKTSHELVLTDLTPETSYLYGLRAVDEAGNEGVNSVFTFVTLVAEEEEVLPEDPEGVDEPEDEDEVVPVFTGVARDDEEMEFDDEVADETSGGLMSGATIVIGDVVESIEGVTGGNGEYYLLGLLLLILLLMILLIVLLVKKKKQEPEGKVEEIKEEVKEVVNAVEEKVTEKGDGKKTLKIVFLILGAIILLSGGYFLYLSMQEEEALEEQNVVIDVEVAREIETNELDEPIVCTSGVLGISFQLFEEGWTCEVMDTPDVNGGHIRVEHDDLVMMISNLGRGGYCMGPIGDDGLYEEHPCYIDEITLTDNVEVKKYSDDESGEIFGSVQLADKPWMSITYDGIHENDLTEDEKAALLRVLSSLTEL